MSESEFADITFASAWISLFISGAIMIIILLFDRYIKEIGNVTMIFIAILVEAIVMYFLTKYFFRRKPHHYETT